MSTRRGPRRNTACGPKRFSGRTCSLVDLVSGFISEPGYGPEEDREFYKGKKSLRAVIEAAGMARTLRNDREVRHPHQRRISKETLRKARARLVTSAAEIERCKSFHDLLDCVERAIRSISGIGELMVYDTAVRIGFHMKLEPEFVYLHAGTRKGAAALGLGRGRKFLEVAELPSELRNLKPGQIEDFLCIFKAELRTAKRLES